MVKGFLDGSYEYAALALDRSAQSGGSESLRSSLYFLQEQCGTYFHSAYALAMQCHKLRVLIKSVLPSVFIRAGSQLQMLAMVAIYDTLFSSRRRVRLHNEKLHSGHTFVFSANWHSLVLSEIVKHRKSMTNAIASQYGSMSAAKKHFDKENSLASNTFRYARLNALRLSHQLLQCKSSKIECQICLQCSGKSDWRRRLEHGMDWLIENLRKEGFRYVESEQSRSETGTPFWRDSLLPDVFVFPPSTKLYNCKQVTDGHLVLQDKGSCMPAYVVVSALENVWNSSSGSKRPFAILDACAAPGNKSLHAASLLAIVNSEMYQRGGDIAPQVISVERDQRRFDLLFKRLQELGSPETPVLYDDFLELHANSSELSSYDVKAIILDPSCSGSGMQTRSDIGAGDKMQSESRLQALQKFQLQMLIHALTAFSQLDIV
eukprot:CAMPEP_0182451292 /NCGR_PEP_ID=MMETSP1172-20130603/43641_1 /TAXON_ID=708627 /ORGANISM="Timspurckia oligopyrenoides, Strain CCMP3278" /LENGTH=432 /DNA_ID=CAMNT_0024649055 /DNA_START=581 /DNA_END=1879 /DNA_ORIENTATION=-